MTDPIKPSKSPPGVTPPEDPSCSYPPRVVPDTEPDAEAKAQGAAKLLDKLLEGSAPQKVSKVHVAEAAPRLAGSDYRRRGNLFSWDSTAPDYGPSILAQIIQVFPADILEKVGFDRKPQHRDRDVFLVDLRRYTARTLGLRIDLMDSLVVQGCATRDPKEEDLPSLIGDLTFRSRGLTLSRLPPIWRVVAMLDLLYYARGGNPANGFDWQVAIGTLKEEKRERLTRGEETFDDLTVLDRLTASLLSYRAVSVPKLDPEQLAHLEGFVTSLTNLKKVLEFPVDTTTEAAKVEEVLKDLAAVLFHYNDLSLQGARYKEVVVTTEQLFTLFPEASRRLDLDDLVREEVVTVTLIRLGLMEPEDKLEIVLRYLFHLAQQLNEIHFYFLDLVDDPEAEAEGKLDKLNELDDQYLRFRAVSPSRDPVPPNREVLSRLTVASLQEDIESTYPGALVELQLRREAPWTSRNQFLKKVAHEAALKRGISRKTLESIVATALFPQSSKGALQYSWQALGYIDFGLGAFKYIHLDWAIDIILDCLAQSPHADERDRFERDVIILMNEVTDPAFADKVCERVSRIYAAWLESPVQVSERLAEAARSSQENGKNRGATYLYTASEKILKEWHGAQLAVAGIEVASLIPVRRQLAGLQETLYKIHKERGNLLEALNYRLAYLTSLPLLEGMDRAIEEGLSCLTESLEEGLAGSAGAAYSCLAGYYEATEQYANAAYCYEEIADIFISFQGGVPHIGHLLYQSLVQESLRMMEVCRAQALEREQTPSEALTNLKPVTRVREEGREEGTEEHLAPLLLAEGGKKTLPVTDGPLSPNTFSVSALFEALARFGAKEEVTDIFGPANLDLEETVFSGSEALLGYLRQRVAENLGVEPEVIDRLIRLRQERMPIFEEEIPQVWLYAELILGFHNQWLDCFEALADEWPALGKLRMISGEKFFGGTVIIPRADWDEFYLNLIYDGIEMDQLDETAGFIVDEIIQQYCLGDPAVRSHLDPQVIESLIAMISLQREVTHELFTNEDRPIHTPNQGDFSLRGTALRQLHLTDQLTRLAARRANRMIIPYEILDRYRHRLLVEPFLEALDEFEPGSVERYLKDEIDKPRVHRNPLTTVLRRKAAEAYLLSSPVTTTLASVVLKNQAQERPLRPEDEALVYLDMLTGRFDSPHWRGAFYLVLTQERTKNPTDPQITHLENLYGILSSRGFVDQQPGLAVDNPPVMVHQRPVVKADTELSFVTSEIHLPYSLPDPEEGGPVTPASETGGGGSTPYMPGDSGNKMSGTLGSMNPEEEGLVEDQEAQDETDLFGRPRKISPTRRFLTGVNPHLGPFSIRNDTRDAPFLGANYGVNLSTPVPGLGVLFHPAGSPIVVNLGRVVNPALGVLSGLVGGQSPSFARGVFAIPMPIAAP